MQEVVVEKFVSGQSVAAATATDRKRGSNGRINVERRDIAKTIDGAGDDKREVQELLGETIAEFESVDRGQGGLGRRFVVGILTCSPKKFMRSTVSVWRQKLSTRCTQGEGTNSR